MSIDGVLSLDLIRGALEEFAALNPTMKLGTPNILEANGVALVTCKWRITGTQLAVTLPDKFRHKMGLIMTGHILEQSIRDLHHIIESWVSGKVEKTKTELSRFAELLTLDFTIISPGGTLATRDAILREIEDAYGKLPGLVIEIENFNLVATDRSLAVASYEEFQQWPGGANGRHSTALFVSQKNSELGYLWRHIHETWLDTTATEEN